LFAEVLKSRKRGDVADMISLDLEDFEIRHPRQRPNIADLVVSQGCQAIASVNSL